MTDLFNETVRTIAHGTAVAVTATGDGNGLDIRPAIGNILLIVPTARVTGTNPTLIYTVEHADASDGSWEDIPAAAVLGGVAGAEFTQITASLGLSQEKVIDSRAVKAFIRIERTIGGTDTPTFASPVIVQYVKANK